MNIEHTNLPFIFLMQLTSYIVKDLDNIFAKA